MSNLLKDNKELMKEYNYEKNKEFNLNILTLGMGKKIWWICNRGHEWEATIGSRYRMKAGCPVCSNRKALKGYNDLLTLFPHVANEWNYKRNTISPEKVVYSSNKKAWWICPKGHEWQAKIIDRTKKNGTNCPYCANQKILTGYNDLNTTNPELVKEWNYKKNINIKPSEVSPGSNKKVWWKCSKGHEWQATIVGRTQGHSCPYCSGRNTVKGENDLYTLKPDLVKEWNYEKNGNLTPDNISIFSNKKVWWKCSKGHEWQASVSNRSQNRNCPYCSNKKIIIGYNDLTTTNPELIKEWNYKKNINIKPTEISSGCGKKVWWKCSKGHEWQATVAHRARGFITNCPICDKERHISLPEKIIYYYIKKYFPAALENYSPKEFGKRDLDIYIKDKNIGIEYDGSYYHKSVEKDLNKDLICNKNNIKLFRVRENACKRYESSSFKIYVEENSIEDLTNAIITILIDIGIKEPHVDIKVDLTKVYEMIEFYEKKNSLLSIAPNLAKEWNYEKNGNLTPENIQGKSGKLVWWKCSKGHEWQAKVLNRMNGKNCPYCSNQKVLEGYNDLATTNPILVKEWNYEKNCDLKPNQITSGSGKKVWWKCEKGHEWITAINHRTGKQNTNCPYCSNRKILIGYNDLLSKFPEIAKEWNYEKNGEKKPTEFVYGSGKKVWWKCEKCNYEWSTTIVKRTMRGQGCPKCNRNGELNESKNS